LTPEGAATRFRVAPAAAPPKNKRESSRDVGQHGCRLRNLTFGFFDGSGFPESRILMFYSFETEDNLARSGILHYHVEEGRFVGPRQDRELTSAALDFLAEAGRIPAPPR
jgi:hypothetical protein